MALRVKIAALAEGQLRRAADWWLENRPAAPGAIADDFAETVALLALHPSIGAEYEGARTPNVRRVFLGRVGYFVYYAVNNGELHVLAFWHASRGRQPLL